MKRQLALNRIGWQVLPYLYFIGMGACWFFMQINAGQGFNYVAMGIILILMAQAIIQHKATGVALGIFGIVVNFFFFLAVLAEFSEFEVLSVSAIELITVGSVLSWSGLAMGVIMTTTNGKKLDK